MNWHDLLLVVAATVKAVKAAKAATTTTTTTTGASSIRWLCVLVGGREKSLLFALKSQLITLH